MGLNSNQKIFLMVKILIQYLTAENVLIFDNLYSTQKVNKLKKQ